MSVVLDQPGYGPLVLKKGQKAHLGSVTAANDAIKFVLPQISHEFQGKVNFHLIQDAGTTTVVTANLQLSLDDGTTFNDLGDTPATVKIATGKSGGAGAIDVSGLGGQLLQLFFSAITLGGAAKIDVYAVLG